MRRKKKEMKLCRSFQYYTEMTASKWRDTPNPWDECAKRHCVLAELVFSSSRGIHFSEKYSSSSSARLLSSSFFFLCGVCWISLSLPISFIRSVPASCKAHRKSNIVLETLLFRFLLGSESGSKPFSFWDWFYVLASPYLLLRKHYIHGCTWARVPMSNCREYVCDA